MSNYSFNICILSIYISSDKKLLLLIQLLGLKLFINLSLRSCNNGGSQMGLSFCRRLSNQHDGTCRCVVYGRMTMSFTSNKSRHCSWIGRLQNLEILAWLLLSSPLGHRVHTFSLGSGTIRLCARSTAEPKSSKSSHPGGVLQSVFLFLQSSQ